MKLEISFSQKNIESIQKMLKNNGYKPLDQSALQEILEIKLEAMMEYYFDSEAMIEFLEELVDAGELEKLEETEEE